MLCTLRKLFESYAKAPVGSIVDISELRMLLAQTHTGNFPLHEPADAMEALGAVLTGIHSYWDGLCPEFEPCLAHEIFPRTFNQRVSCDNCGSVHEESWASALFMEHCHSRHIYSGSGETQILSADMRNPGDAFSKSELTRVVDTLPQRIRRSWSADYEERCQNGNCQSLLRREMVLLGLPTCYVVNLGWNQDSAHPLHIAQVLCSLPPVIDIRSIYQGSPSCMYKLVGLVCYFSSHYVYCVLRNGRWYILDDQQQLKCGQGDWVQLYRSLISNGCQPVGVFYYKCQEAHLVSRRPENFLMIEREIAEQMQKRKEVEQLPAELKCWQCRKPHHFESSYCRHCKEYPYAKGVIRRKLWRCVNCRGEVSSFTETCPACSFRLGFADVGCFNCGGIVRGQYENCPECDVQTTCLECDQPVGLDDPRYCPRCYQSSPASYCVQCEFVNAKPICGFCIHWDCLVCNTQRQQGPECRTCASFRPKMKARDIDHPRCGKCFTSISVEQSRVCYLCRSPTRNWVCFACKLSLYPHTYTCSRCLQDCWTCSTCAAQLPQVCVVCPYHAVSA